MSEPAPADLAELACELATETGEMLRTGHGRKHVVETKSSPTDLVSEMDRAAEELIRRRLAEQRPGDSVLGEEGGQTGADSLVRWIVDPLDGTVNYLYGLPDWAVSIAAEVAGRVVAGAVCAPLHRTLYSATIGGGAWLRSGWQDRPERLACNTGVPLAGALVATGFGYDSGRRRWQGRVVAGVLPRVRDIRRAGSAALDLCSVAAGRMDGYYERGVHAWDIAAGSLIARESGAVVAGLAGRPAGESITVAAGPGLFGELQDLLASLDPERDG